MQPFNLQIFRLGLIGYPLGHSLSPKIHAAALEACGLDGIYSLFPTAPHDRRSLKDLLYRVRSGEIHGLNVTIPHKQIIIPYMDELTPTAQSIGAVNTVYLREDKLIGENTDGPGFLSDLKKFLTTETRSPSRMIRHGDARALVLGAGGSGRAVVNALVNDGWQITLAARRIEQARQLADSLTHNNLQITDFPPSNSQLSNISLIVNTTPIGMAPHTDQSPWPENLPFPPHANIYDLVYNPRETKLVRDACLQGLSATTGLGMLIEQAALSFQIWTGHNPPREAMFDALTQSAH